MAAKRFINNPGSPIVPVRDIMVMPDGTSHVVTIGTHNIQDEIQSYADECAIPNIMARFNAGDTSALSAFTPMFGDFTNAPKTYAEFLQKQIDGKRIFESLSPEVKDKFGNSYERFVASSTEPDFLEKTGLVKATPDELKASAALQQSLTEPVLDKIQKEVVS